MNTTSQNNPSLDNAAAQLNAALQRLDAALGPVTSRLTQAEARAAEAEQRVSDASGFDEDRARLARELDDTTARAEAAESRLRAREEEFAALSGETRRELDQTIATLRDALSEAG